MVSHSNPLTPSRFSAPCRAGWETGEASWSSEKLSQNVKQKLLDDLSKLKHLPHKLVRGEAGLQTAWGFLRLTIPSRFLRVLRGRAVEVTEFCDEVQETIHRILGQRTDQGRLTARQQRIVELTHSFREAIIEKERGDLEARWQPKMETPPKDIVGNVHALPVGRSVKAISGNLTKILPHQELQRCLDVC